jgi:hypothetical protein
MMRPFLSVLALCVAVVGSELRIVPGTESKADVPFTVLSKSVGSRPQARFVDAEGRLIYGFRTTGLKRLRVVLRLANNFRVSFSMDGKSWHESLNAMEIHGRDRRDGEVATYGMNLDDMLPFDAIYLLFRDGSPTDGWGAYVAEVTLDSDAPEGYDWKLPPPPPPPGMITRWQVLGSFPTHDRQHLLDPPAGIADPSALCPPTGGNWQPVERKSGKVSLLDNALKLSPKSDSLAYAHVFVHVEKDTDAVLLAGSDDALGVYVNGALIWRHEVLRGYRVDEDRVPICLGKGWNRILLAVGNGAAGWDFGARIVQPDGALIPGLRTQADPPAELKGELPMPNLPPRIELSSVQLAPDRARLENGKLQIPLVVELVNRGGSGGAKQTLTLRHGKETVQQWELAAKGRGLLAEELTFSDASWDTMTNVVFPLTIALDNDEWPLDCPFLPRLLAEAGDTLWESHQKEAQILRRLGLAKRHWRNAEVPAASWRELAVTWFNLARAGRWYELGKAVAQFQDTDDGLWSTSVQCAARADKRYDISPDAVMVYGGTDPAPRLRQWRRRGARVQIMTGIAWGGYQDYQDGRYDGKRHDDEIQTRKNGELMCHDGDVYYWVPTESYGKYLCKRLAPALDLPADGVCLEEPEFWIRAGWSPAFKREWSAYFGEPWQDPDSSPETRYRAWKLRRFLYTRCLKQVADYLKERRPDWECIVATHSLINYTSWGIASPESALSSIESCDTVIAQVWNDTICTPCNYNGKHRSRPFATAYLEFAQMAGMIGYSGRSLVFLADPVADNAERSWELCRQLYEQTVVAGLFQGNANRFELMPWPDRVFKGRRPLTSRTEEPETMPDAYRTSLLATCEALRNMPQGTAQTSPIAVTVSDSMQAQAGFGDATNSADFFGQALPLVLRGWQPRVVHLEQVTDKRVLRDVRVLLLSYNGQTPPDEAAHKALVAWVQGGGILLSLTDPNDPFQRVREWWNEEKAQLPQQHLYESLGLGTDPSEGWHEAGKGQVLVQHIMPRRFAAAKGDARLVAWVNEAATKAGIELKPKSHSVVRRGPYIAAASCVEATDAEPLTLEGQYIDIFADGLPLVTNPTLESGRCGLWVDLSKATAPGVLASASRIDGWHATDGNADFVSSAPYGGQVVTLVHLDRPPAGVAVRLHNGMALYPSVTWHAEQHCLRLRYPANADGVWVRIAL